MGNYERTIGGDLENLGALIYLEQVGSFDAIVHFEKPSQRWSQVFVSRLFSRRYNSKRFVLERIKKETSQAPRQQRLRITESSTVNSAAGMIMLVVTVFQL